jgi:hypothetical protein
LHPGYWRGVYSAEKGGTDLISQDDIDAFTEEPKQQYLNDPVFQRLQWEVHAAFEAGYTAAGGDRGQSVNRPEKGKWFDHWITSKSRAFLVANGLMTGDEPYK